MDKKLVPGSNRTEPKPTKRKSAGPRMGMKRSGRQPQAIDVPRPSAQERVAELLEDLEFACLDAIKGDPPGALLASRLQRVCLDVLRSRGFGDVRVSVESTRASTHVRLWVPRPDNTVREVVLSLG